MINNIQAIEQPLDFEELYPVCTCATDVDGVIRLKNGKIVMIEIKKDTPRHDYNSIKHNSQYACLKALAGNRNGIIFIYATHNLPIDINIPIKPSDCIVKHVECNGISDDKYKSMSLKQCILDLNNKIETTLPNLYILVKYKDGNLEYAVNDPKNKKWSVKQYNPTLNRFNSYQDAYNYIQDRYLKSFNHDKEYWLFKIENSSHHMIGQFLYNKTMDDTLLIY